MKQVKVEEYNGPVLQVEFKTDNGTIHKKILETMHTAFKGKQDYIDSNIVVSESYDNGNIAGVYVCLDDVKDVTSLQSALSELSIRIPAIIKDEDKDEENVSEKD